MTIFIQPQKAQSVTLCCLSGLPEDQAKGQKGQEMRVNPVPPVVLVPKKTDKVQNDPERRKIKKKDKR
jgi:hypothetical protein